MSETSVGAVTTPIPTEAEAPSTHSVALADMGEYRIVSLSGGGYFADAEHPTEDELNDLVVDGWELATSLDSSRPKLGGQGGSTTTLVFKRPREDEGDRSTAPDAGTGQ